MRDGHHDHVADDRRSRAELRAHTGELFAAFPDLHFDVSTLVEEGEQVLVRWVLTGTRSGTFQGVRARTALKARFATR